ncbi:MAG: MTH1187 family thiamine-binding protein [Bacteriovoracaceae bacterium]|nr:MTH1187 family thiamine-binding protein [Bacteriovoracaceae bacterium]
MKVLAQLTIVPLDVGISLSEYVAKVIGHLRQTGLKLEEHSMGTNLEGEWDEVMSAVKSCNELLVDEGVKRISTSLKLSLRLDKEESMKAKLESVNKKIVS